MLNRLFLIFSLLLIFPLTLNAAGLGKKVSHLAYVKEMKHWSTPDYTRVAITLDKEAVFEKHELGKTPGSSIPSRIYFDIKNARLLPNIKNLTTGDNFLKSVRISQYSPDVVRVVLDVKNVKDYKIFTFSDPFMIIVDVRGEQEAELKAETTPFKPTTPVLTSGVPSEGKESTKKPETYSVMKQHKIRRIVIDPGHGGKDPGATGPSGIREKDVVLAIGKLVAKKLKEQLGVDVVMTRSTDVFIELQERTAIANQVGADLFVSIHANASLNPNASGIETYYLNLAKTKKVAELAAKENNTSLAKVSLLQAVLFDLMANYKLNDSAHLADFVQKALDKKVSGQYTGVKNLGVKQGPFYVLVGATMPSILVETAFVSNHQEEERLHDPEYQEQTAQGIVDGIKAYISSLK